MAVVSSIHGSHPRRLRWHMRETEADPAEPQETLFRGQRTPEKGWGVIVPLALDAS